MRIDDMSMQEVVGGGLGATFLSYLSTAMKTVYSIGQELGGSIRRIATGKICPL